jgi:peptidoglycan/LPS O-acetylase OafA/YrhL
LLVAAYGGEVNPRLSTSLDLLRLAAALAVACAHLSHLLTPGMPRWLAGNGQEAVSIFFVLSGYVIAYSVSTREQQWRTYALARAARLYSVVLPCLVAAFVADALGRALSPGWYGATGFIGPGPTAPTLLAYLGFTNELWSSHVVIGTLEPMWSLGFEVPYYVLFGVLLFAPRAVRLPLSLVWAALVGPRVLLYLPLWLLGVGLWHAQQRGFALQRRGAWATLFAVPLLYALWHDRFGPSAAPQYSWPSTSEALFTVAYHGAIAMLVALFLLALAGIARDRPAFASWFARPVRWFAGASFTLYLLNQPLIAFAAALLGPTAPLPAKLLAILLCAVAVLAVAAIGERRKLWFASAIARIFPPHTVAASAAA